jgi:tRNA G46 methylase TrmB
MHESNLTAYLYPNGSLEVERLDTQYNILKILLDGRGCLSPFTQANPPHKVLDIATGSGCWAIDMGDEFPEARIIGTDLSPIQPTSCHLMSSSSSMMRAYPLSIVG